MKAKVYYKISTIQRELNKLQAGARACYSELSKLNSTIAYKRKDWLCAVGKEFRAYQDMAVADELKSRRLLITKVVIIETKIRKLKLSLRLLQSVSNRF